MAHAENSAYASVAYGVDVLALQLGDELLKTVVIGLDSDGFENLLDICGRRRGIAAQVEKKVSSEMLHFVDLFAGNPC